MSLHIAQVVDDRPLRLDKHYAAKLKVSGFAKSGAQAENTRSTLANNRTPEIAHPPTNAPPLLEQINLARQRQKIWSGRCQATAARRVGNERSRWDYVVTENRGEPLQLIIDCTEIVRRRLACLWAMPTV